MMYAQCCSHFKKLLQTDGNVPSSESEWCGQTETRKLFENQMLKEMLRDGSLPKCVTLWGLGAPTAPYKAT